LTRRAACTYHPDLNAKRLFCTLVDFAPNSLPCALGMVLKMCVLAQRVDVGAGPLAAVITDRLALDVSGPVDFEREPMDE